VRLKLNLELNVEIQVVSTESSFHNYCKGTFHLATALVIPSPCVHHCQLLVYTWVCSILQCTFKIQCTLYPATHIDSIILLIAPEGDASNSEVSLGKRCARSFILHPLSEICYVSVSLKYGAIVSCHRSTEHHPHSKLFIAIWNMVNIEGAAFAVLHINMLHTSMNPES